MARPLVVGNWKMNGTASSVASLLTNITTLVNSDADYAVCPPFVYISQVQQALAASNVALGAQNVALEESGAFTGEVSAGMLADVQCQYVIVGHSERRALYGETSEIVAAKTAQVIANGMTAIVCVGETLAEREAGNTIAVVTQQLAAVLAANSENLSSIVVAYEPVWAIGTGLTASPEQAQEVHASLRQQLIAVSDKLGADVKILYGGSVKPDNASSLFSQADINGALVGGASLVAEDFIAIGSVR